MGLLTGGIAKIVQGATKLVTYSISLSRTTIAAGNEAWEVGVTSETAYPCRGVVIDYKDYRIDGTVIKRGDRQVMVIANTLSVVPVSGDKITAQGAIYFVVNVSRDPATATWTLQVRK